MRRRLLIVLILVVNILLSIGWSVPVIAAEGNSCGQNLTWKLSDGTLTISGSGDMTDYSDSRLAPWYESAEEIEMVSLPAGLTSIGDFAFYGCKNLNVISIPSKVTEVGAYAFAQCTGVTRVDLGSVLSIGEGAFQECESLTGISFPSSLDTIGTKAFYRCYSIQALTIPATVKHMGSAAFAYCTGLVRATVNAPLKVLPSWTFYGCSSLVDVSLAPSITSTGEYAFQSCENLNGIYTQTGNSDIAYEIEESIKKDEDSDVDGFVGAFEMPDSSVSTKQEGDTFIQTEITEIGDTVITVEDKIESTGDQSKEETKVSVKVEKEEDWDNALQAATEVLEKGKNCPVIVELNVSEEQVKGKDLAKFAGMQVSVHIITGKDYIWKIEMPDVSAEDFNGKYDLSVLITDTDETEIVSDYVYRVKFADNIDFPAKLGIKRGNPHDLATLYRKNKKLLEPIDTMVVDTDNYAWFALANVRKRTEYYLGVNAEGITLEDAVIPETMYSQYDITEGSYLTDENGIQYRVTGRTSKWGITGKQFAIFVGIVIAGVVLVVAAIMITLNIIQRSKEKYQRMAEEEALREKESEEALRMDIMRELLGEDHEKS